MQRKGSINASSLKGGISKPKADDAPCDIGRISLLSVRESPSRSLLNPRTRRNAVFFAATAAQCVASTSQILSNIATTDCHRQAIDIHIEMLAHGVSLHPRSRGIAQRALQRCFLFADVSVGVIAHMCDYAREMFVSSDSILQPEGSECINVFVSLDGVFSSNGSGSTSCMLAGEESFVLGHMKCTSSITLLHPSHVVMFPAHCFASCSSHQGRFESSLLHVLQSPSSNPAPARRVFLQPTRDRVNLRGRAYQSAAVVSRDLWAPGFCVIAVVYGGCIVRDAAQCIFNLSAGAVIQTTRDRLHSSGVAQDVTDASEDDDASASGSHAPADDGSADCFIAPADDGSADCFIAAADDAAGMISFEVLEAADTGCEFLILLG